MLARPKSRIWAPWTLAGVSGLVAALAIFGWGSLHGDLSAAGLVLSIANLALVSSVWINQRRMSGQLGVWMSRQLASAEDMRAFCDALEASPLRKRDRSRPSGFAGEAKGDPGPSPSRILH